MQLDQAAIQEAVVARITDDILSDWDWKADVRSSVAKRIDAEFAEGLGEIVAEAVESATQAGFDHAYQRIDRFGKLDGKPTTIRKELDRLIQGYWTARVDSSGKPTESNYNSTTRAEWMMVQICGKGFSEQVKAETVSVAGRLKDSLRAELRKATDRMLGELFVVRSLGDQEEGRSR